MEKYKYVYRILRIIRQHLNISQRELGEKCGLSQQAINRMEHGERSVDLQVLFVLSQMAHCSMDDIVKVSEFVTKYDDEQVLKALNSKRVLTYLNKEIIDELADNSTPEEIAKYFSYDEFTEEELEEIKKYAEFIKSKRNKE